MELAIINGTYRDSTAKSAAAGTPRLSNSHTIVRCCRPFRNFVTKWSSCNAYIFINVAIEQCTPHFVRPMNLCSAHICLYYYIIWKCKWLNLEPSSHFLIPHTCTQAWTTKNWNLNSFEYINGAYVYALRVIRRLCCTQ